MSARSTTRTSALIAVGALLAAPLTFSGAAHAADPTPVQVVPPTGVVQGGDPSGLDMSADGRWIAYTGRAGATHGLYVLDRTTGATATLLTGSTPIGTLSISADGNRVAYVLGNPGYGYEGDAQVRLFDRASGASRLVSATAAGVAGNAASWDPDLSEDGTTVTFATRSTNLASGTSGSGSDVLVKVLATGAVERISGADATAESSSPSISADGDLVAFVTNEQLVGGDTDVYDDVVVRTRSTNALTLASTSARAGSASLPAISADGRKVAHLVAEGGRPELIVSGIFVTDLATGAVVRASVSSAGGDMTTPGIAPAISADGRFVLFTGIAQAAGQGARAVEAFVRDLALGTTRWVSTAGPADSFAAAGAAVSGTGHRVVFTALSSNALAIWALDLGDPEPVPTPAEPVNGSPPVLEQVRAASGPSYALVVKAGGEWEGPPGMQYTYQWLRNGRPIEGAGATTYTVKASDFGKKISVRESVVVDGEVAASVESQAITAQKASSTVKTKVVQSGGTKNPVVLDITLSHSPDVRPQGVVVVLWSGGLRIVDVAPDGSARVTIRPRPGRHTVRIVHLPSAYVKAAPMERITVQAGR